MNGRFVLPAVAVVVIGAALIAVLLGSRGTPGPAAVASGSPGASATDASTAVPGASGLASAPAALTIAGAALPVFVSTNGDAAAGLRHRS